VKLEEAVVLVTGGGRGIGRAIATAFVNAGSRVAICGRTEAQVQQTATEIGATPLVRDITDRLAVEEMFRRVESDLGPLEVLVANAGRLRAIGPTWEVDPEQWGADLRTNVEGTFFCCRAALAGMVQRRAGCAILISSGAGPCGPHPFGSAYGLSKLAIASLAEHLAVELGDAGPVVFAVDPGTVRTDMTQHLVDDAVAQQHLPHVERIFQQGWDIPPETAAKLCTTLASGQADALTGRFLRATDDLAALTTDAERIRAEKLRLVRVRGLD
jgi:NAD(P)-dependent dehydrogenase (short-subunit alcohol dehydrogenase family)